MGTMEAPVEDFRASDFCCILTIRVGDFELVFDNDREVVSFVEIVVEACSKKERSGALVAEDPQDFSVHGQGYHAVGGVNSPKRSGG